MATYSFIDVQATLAGPTGVVNMGYGAATAEEGITIAAAADKNTMTIGSDGEGMHSLHADKSGQITVRLLKTSPINQALMIQYDAQTLSSTLHGKNVITVRNSVSGDITVARGVAFKRAPDLTYAKDGGIVEWQFDAIKIDRNLGTYN
ncbi:phage protein [Achromobacter sp. DH1f]|uniref:phage protein n=1 Tax=Achromobacter sp. DH1f TaxID=1397275 RepID=UPI00046A6285|nr:phage protein [Achromobacter sp. DH1f]